MLPAHLKGHDTLVDALRSSFEEKEALARERRETFEAARQKAIQDRVDLAKDAPRLEELEALKKAYDDANESAQTALGRWSDTMKGGKGHAATSKGREGRLDGIGAEFIKSLGGRELKALVSGASVVPPFFDQRIRDLPQRQMFVRSLIPVLRADSDLVSYLRQTATTNAAAPVAAGGLKPTSVFSVEKVDQPVRVVAHLSEAIDRSLLADQDALTDFLDQQLRLGILLAEEQQIISGSGTAPNLRGILNTAGISSVTRNVAGSEPSIEAIQRAITLVRLSFFEPDAIVLHPSDYSEIRIMKDSTGQYLAGPITDDGPPTLLGHEVVTSPVLSEGVAIVGAFAAGATVWEREEARVTFAETGLGDAAGEEMFSRNLVRFRAEERIAFGVERPSAFCQVLSI